MNTLMIYDKVERLRKDKNLTIYALSNQAGISHSTLYSWHSRKTMPTLDVLEKICDALNITLSELLFDSNANELSEEQQRVLEMFSQLTREQKELIQNTMKNMIK